jgi:hypothetical protein
MQAIGDYTFIVKLALVEGGKYLLLLFLVAFALRLWRFAKVATELKRSKAIVFAMVSSLVAVFVGYCVLASSLSQIYAAKGRIAFRDSKLKMALAAFESSSRCWRTADNVGEQGVIRLLLGQSQAAMPLLAEAKMRRGRNTPFEQFYGGLFFFFDGSPERALPLLQGAAADQRFQWDATKLIAVILIESGHSNDAVEIMKPFRAIEIKDPDHAYVLALLDLQKGRKVEARAELDHFSNEKLSHFWQTRFSKIRNQTFES